ncbi:rluD [Symbiodinium sp. CCMP2456]|nr:rluD [Symbiodinium sp. CCMP2456]
MCSYSRRHLHRPAHRNWWIWHRHVPFWRFADLAAAARGFAKVVSTERLSFEEVKARAGVIEKEAHAKDISNIGPANLAWRLGRSDSTWGSPSEDTAGTATPSLHSGASQATSNLAWSRGSHGVVREVPLQAASSLGDFQELKAQHPANAAQNLGQLQAISEPSTAATGAEATCRTGGPKLQELAAAAWNLGATKCRGDPSPSATADAGLRAEEPRKAQEASNLLRDPGTAQAVQTPVSNVLMEAACLTTELSAQGLANAAQSTGTPASEHDPATRVAGARAVEEISELSLQGLSNSARTPGTAAAFDMRLPEAAATRFRSLPARDWDPGARERHDQLLGLVSALALSTQGAEELPPLVEVATRTEELLSRRAQEMDAKDSPATSPDLDDFRPRAGERPGNRPCILLEGREACVLWKPPGWTVSVGSFDEDEEERAWRSGGKAGKLLQAWVMDNLGPHWPIARDEKAEFGLVHRLDRDTSGPILCAKTYRGFHGLQLCLVRFQLRKDYVCLCEGFLSAPRLLDAKLRVEGSGRSLRSVVAPRGRGQRAVLEILQASHFLTENSEAVSLVRIRLRTGRMHQIRAQLSSLGHPLLGDVLYGTPRAWLPRIFLHAASVGISVHGLHGEPFQVDCVLPPDLQQALVRCVPLDSWSCQSRKGRKPSSQEAFLPEAYRPVLQDRAERSRIFEVRYLMANRDSFLATGRMRRPEELNLHACFLPGLCLHSVRDCRPQTEMCLADPTCAMTLVRGCLLVLIGASVEQLRQYCARDGIPSCTQITHLYQQVAKGMATMLVLTLTVCIHDPVEPHGTLSLAMLWNEAS